MLRHRSDTGLETSTGGSAMTIARVAMLIDRRESLQVGLVGWKKLIRGHRQSFEWPRIASRLSRVLRVIDVAHDASWKFLRQSLERSSLNFNQREVPSPFFPTAHKTSETLNDALISHRELSSFTSERIHLQRPLIPARLASLAGARRKIAGCWTGWPATLKPQRGIFTAELTGPGWPDGNDDR